MANTTTNQDHRATTLLTIPPELRLKIYSDLLTGYVTFELWPKSRLIVDKTTKPSTRIKTYLTRRSDAPDPGISAAILRTCRRINQEASSILYKTNHFATLGSNIPRFINQIGANVESLRHIELKGLRNGTELSRTFEALRNASNLSKLVVRYDPLTDGIKADTLIMDLVSVVRSWAQARDASGQGIEGVVSVIEILPKEQRTIIQGRGWVHESADASVAKEVEDRARKAILEMLEKERF